MRKRIVAGNWKMNLDLSQGRELVEQLKLKSFKQGVEVIVIPPFVHLSLIKELLKTSDIKLAAQNVHAEISGAYTGEISAKMLASLDLDYCLVGHSERRIYQKESDVELQAKIQRLLEEEIGIIYCVGETLEERQGGRHFDLIDQQLQTVFNLSIQDFSKVVLAYEPVWAIGTGETATASQAEEMHAFIRQKIEKRYNSEVSEMTSILYGGSCKPGNAEELFSQPNVDGGLIGGASLNAEDFHSIIAAR